MRAAYPIIGKYCRGMFLAVYARSILVPMQPIINRRNLRCRGCMEDDIVAGARFGERERERDLCNYILLGFCLQICLQICLYFCSKKTIYI